MKPDFQRESSGIMKLSCVFTLSLPAVATALALAPSWKSVATNQLPSSGESLIPEGRRACAELSWPEDEVGPPDFVLLTVPQEHATALQQLSAAAARRLSAGLLVGVLGMAIGGTPDSWYMKDGPGISLLAGKWRRLRRRKTFIVSGERFPTWSKSQARRTTHPFLFSLTPSRRALK